ncbi:HNH endonuclease [Dyadobacter diqingensis]|uniref:HNH endonuclease n=1 Tax=Dyadobacter diqingensis TaxID=2938121 RepID=UPI0020C19F61|nr:HNH endonuclease [Dyadobacter diqingensis]
MVVLNDLKQALINLNGKGSLKEIFREYSKLNRNPIMSTVRRTLQQHSSDTKSYSNKEDLFFSVEGLGKGIWGLRNFEVFNIRNENYTSFRVGNETPERHIAVYNRIKRDTLLVQEIKRMVKSTCQLCQENIEFPNGKLYSEGHHLRPLGQPHNGPDVKHNIIILCPNCHVRCDNGLVWLDRKKIANNKQGVGQEFIDYHNLRIFKVPQ